MVEEHLGALVCPHVFDHSKPALVVCRRNGEYQFLCGSEHTKAERPRVVGVSHLLDHDKSLNELLEPGAEKRFPENWFAERTALGAEWEVSELEAE